MTPSLPPERRVELAGRGTVGVRELPGPPGAPTLVLLHGWTVTADLNWFRCYSELGRTYRVLAFDHRGHGRGLRPAVRFRMTDCANDVAAVVEALGIDRFIAVGYSMGGCVAQLLARDHPHLLAGMVLCATSRSFRGSGWERARFSLLPPLADLAKVTPLRLRDAVYNRVLESQISGDGLTEWARDEIRSCDPQFLLDAGAELYRFDSSSWAPSLRLPAAVVVTERDGRVPPERQRALAASLPDTSVHRSDGNHTVCVGAPQRFLPPLLDAVSSVLARSVGTSLGDSRRPAAGADVGNNSSGPAPSTPPATTPRARR
ncbi:MAG: alpha/beta hydrolase [Acidimicrobiales bacterium]|nr:alpha/beta hydrolase [Acidimicrobiales bacterium]